MEAAGIEPASAETATGYLAYSVLAAVNPLRGRLRSLGAPIPSAARLDGCFTRG